MGTIPATAQSPSSRFFPLVVALFAGSGCAALIYEIVWFQLLQLVIGSSAVSLGVLLGTFMGGMCLGSLGFPRLVTSRQHPLRIYALLELLIGLFGILLLLGMPLVDGLYTAVAGYGFPGVFLRAVICAFCLLPPTLLMGATLPAIARWAENTPSGISWLGFFYGGNIAGAVFGCLLAGFYLLRVHDMATATYVAAAINVAVALIGFGLARRTAPIPADDSKPGPRTHWRDLWPVHPTIALSGFCALGAEVVWTRQLSLLLGATVYTFSIVLAVFLAGLGIGSSAGASLARTTQRPRIALGWCQLLLAAAIAWTAFMLGRSLPYWPINPYLSTGPWFTFQIDIVRCLWTLLPAACLWGASFPLALASVAYRGQDTGRLVGGVYAANTIGAIAGAIGFTALVIPWAGTQQAERLLIAVSTVAALLMFLPALRLFRSHGMPGSGSPHGTPESAELASVALFVLLAALLAWSVPQIAPGVVAYGRALPTYTSLPEFLYVGEGMNASIAVSELSNGARNFHVSGKVEASTEPQDMRLQRMLGHIPGLMHPRPRSVLIVGFGAGVTAGTFVLYPGIERIVICEIEPLIPRIVSQYFSQENYRVLQDLRVEMVYDDARHYILTTREKFDVITSDPIHPWVKGAATLYTREYFELVKRHLNPGGLVTQWVPLYESSSQVVKSEMATFFEVFPQGTIWGNENAGEGYDTVLLGQAESARIEADRIQDRLEAGAYQAVRLSLSEVGFSSSIDLWATYAGQAPDLGPWLLDAEINRDRNLRLQYLAGMWLNAYQGTRIFGEILAFRRFPEKLFSCSDKRKQILRNALARPRR